MLLVGWKEGHPAGKKLSGEALAAGRSEVQISAGSVLKLKLQFWRKTELKPRFRRGVQVGFETALG